LHIGANPSQPVRQRCSFRPEPALGRVVVVMMLGVMMLVVMVPGGKRRAGKNHQEQNSG